MNNKTPDKTSGGRPTVKSLHFDLINLAALVDKLREEINKRDSKKCGDNRKPEKTFDAYGEPRRHYEPWSANELTALTLSFKEFVNRRAKVHERTIGAIQARIEHSGMLREY